MKRIIYTLSILAFFCLSLGAQNSAGLVEEDVKIMQFGAENAFSINLTDTDPELVREVWKSYVRTNFRSGVKYDRKSAEFIAENARVHIITGFPVNLIASATELGPDVHFTIWIDLQGAYLSSEQHPKQAVEVEYILHDFAIQVERVKIEDRLRAEEKELARLQRELQRLEKAKARYQREIEISDHWLERMKENIAENEIEQKTTSQEIAQQIKVVEEIRRELLTVNL